MNKNLTFEIINHIFVGLGVNTSTLDLKNFQSMKSKEFLIKNNLSFLDENNQEIKKNVWATQFMFNDNKIKILLGDCTTDSDVVQYSAIVHLDKNPYYGFSLCYSNNKTSYVDPQPLLAVSLDAKNWMECNTYLQATFLAAMENIKDINYLYKKCDDVNLEFEALQSFVKYYDNFYEVKNEGEEN